MPATPSDSHAPSSATIEVPTRSMRISLDVGNQSGVLRPVHPFGKRRDPQPEVDCRSTGARGHAACRRAEATVRPQRGRQASAAVMKAATASITFVFRGGLASPGNRWVHQEHVHVTVGVTVTTGRRTEGTGIEGLRLPAAELLPHATPELDPKISHSGGNGGSNVLPIELVDPVPPHLRGLHQPLVDQSGQASSVRRSPIHAQLSAATSPAVRGRPEWARAARTGPSSDGCDRPRGVSHVHDHII